SERFVPDPWAPGALDGPLASGDDVLLVGTGLTAVDVALTLGRQDRTVHAVSRGGAFPAAHAVTPLPPVAPPEALDGLPLSRLRRDVYRHVRRTLRCHGDWRPALDGLRPMTARLWSALPDGEKAEFLARDRSLWNSHRHRMAPATAESVARLLEAHRLRVSTGQVAAVRNVETDDGAPLSVTLDNGRTLNVGWVVDCTGPATRVAESADPLDRGLLTSGLAVPGPLGIGYATDADGRLVGSDPAARRPLWTLGAPRRGELWESTAVPEIRGQAARIAQVLLDTVAPLPATPPRRRPLDNLGEPLSTDPSTAAAYRLGLQRLMTVRSGADRAFRQAAELDPGFALAHAALAMLGHEGGAEIDVPRALADAQRAVRERGDARERALVDVVTRRIQGRPGDGDAVLLHHIDEHPRDALALSMAVPTIAFSGVTDLQEEAYELVERTAPAHEGHWFHTSLLAFIRQELGAFDEAGALARAALGSEEASGHAVHALAHVHYECGDHRDGLRWLDAWIGRHGQGATHGAHFAWHAALHELALDDATAVRRRWSGQLAPPQVRGIRALVDSASMLWRAQLTGQWTGTVPIDEVLDEVAHETLERPVTAFTALHSVMALGAAREVCALRRLGRYAARHGDPVLREVIRPLCDAMIAVTEERWDDAATVLRAILPALPRVGGSAAQREVVEETLLYALVSAGRCAEADRLLQDRLDRRSSPLDHRRQLGLAAV
ncbi:lycopene cyclase, partial [Streptomyces sp. UNOC14_S4]|uniref:lycopene cyclase n=1 Tax=Streptomyces sp. UNOC14_S4 TaxID=2872340 RepID=UPI001E4C0009